MSNIINKVKDALHSDKSSAPEGTTGPHSSRAANAADPRVDSDMDHSRNAGMRKTAGHGEYGSSGVGNTMGSSTMGSSGMSEGATGPHSSRIANAADPRVDSDRDGSRTMGGNTGSNAYGSSNTRTAGNTVGMGSSGMSEGATGPHNSRIANAADPRVDSDRDGSRTAGGLGSSGNAFGSSNTGNTFGSSSMTGTHGTHGTSTGTHGLHSSGPGPADNTAGPHSSDMANKLDPRVDSDMDGSKTMGQNKTYQ